jgi:hypothetical protein
MICARPSLTVQRSFGRAAIVSSANERGAGQHVRRV